MLKRLSVKNFAVVEEQTLELSAGLNVLTGETGAGKSILVEALGFLLGARGSASWLRAGAARLEVSGWFEREDFPKEARARFKLAEPFVAVRRELDASGRTRAWVNGQPAPLAALAELGAALVDFHGQHEHQSLTRPAAQLELLDRFGGLEREGAAVAEAFSAWSALKAELEAARMSDEERRRRLDLGRFQLSEIDEAKLKAGEDAELEAALPRLKNAERLRALADGAYGLLYEQEGSVLAGLMKAERALSELSRIDEGLRPEQGRLEEARLALDELAHRLGEYRDRLEADPAELDAALSRQEKLARLKKRYGATVEEILAFRERLAGELDRLENGERRASELEGTIAAAEAKLAGLCERLHESRRKAAKRLEGAIQKELKSLGLAAAEFSIAVEMEEGRFTSSGCDEIEFMIAPNPGEPQKPLRTVASGGELSRVMLALKTVLAKADRVPVLVFDEVDAGIGGTVARAVGERLAALGRERQVLCVTHLPQVACFGRAHFNALKAVEGRRTFTKIERLDDAARLETIALMLGGREATAASRRHAKELLESSLQ